MINLCLNSFLYLKFLFIWRSNPKRQIFDKLFSNLFNLILMLGNYSKLQQFEAYWSSTACVWQMRTSSLIYAIISLSSLLFSALSHASALKTGCVFVTDCVTLKHIQCDFHLFLAFVFLFQPIIWAPFFYTELRGIRFFSFGSEVLPEMELQE